jgi:hypothetical protein
VIDVPLSEITCVQGNKCYYVKNITHLQQMKVHQVYKSVIKTYYISVSFPTFCLKA